MFYVTYPTFPKHIFYICTPFEPRDDFVFRKLCSFLKIVEQNYIIVFDVSVLKIRRMNEKMDLLDVFIYLADVLPISLIAKKACHPWFTNLPNEYVLSLPTLPKSMSMVHRPYRKACQQTLQNSM